MLSDSWIAYENEWNNVNIRLLNVIEKMWNIE